MKRRATALRSFIAILITLLFFQGCSKLPPVDNDESSEISINDVSTDISGDDVPPISEILNLLDTYFADKPTGAYRTPYIVVENYADLCVIYEYAQEYAGKRPKESYILRIQGNVNEARINDSYPPEYFESGYVIAALIKTGSGSYTFECSATKNDGEIIVSLHGYLPMPCTCDLGGYIYLVPVDGVYADESIEIVKTYTEETSFELKSYRQEEAFSADTVFVEYALIFAIENGVLWLSSPQDDVPEHDRLPNYSCSAYGMGYNLRYEAERLAESSIKWTVII